MLLGEFKTGFITSGLLHGAALLWVLIGGFFISREIDPIPVTDVSIISGEDFAALLPQSPEAVTDAPDPAQPQIEEAPEPPQSTPEPAPEPDPVAEPEPVEPVPDPAPEPEPAPRPQPAVPDQPLDPGPDAAPNVDAEATPTPQAAPNVAQEAAPAPEPEVQTDEVAQSQTAPSETAEPVEEEAPQDTAPEEASTDIVTEAEEQPSSAPQASIRPTARPARPAIVAQEEPAEEVPAEDPIAASVAAAVSENAAEETAISEAPAAQVGPPMTSGEKDSFGRQINNCWSVGALSTEAKNTVIAVDFDMLPDGRPDFNSLTLFSGEGASDAAIQRAFQNARSTIIRCGQQGYDLPRDKYEQWKQVRVIFDASGAQYR